MNPSSVIAVLVPYGRTSSRTGSNGPIPAGPLGPRLDGVRVTPPRSSGACFQRRLRPELMTFDPYGSDGRHRTARPSVSENRRMNRKQGLHVTGRIRVLVASTDRHLRSVLCWSLEHDERCQVVVQASDGDAVVACRCAFDVAVVDVAISGLGIMGVIGRLRDRKPAPLVVVLAHTDAIYLRHALQAEGASGYLVMPDDLDHLGERLVEVFKENTAELARA